MKIPRFVCLSFAAIFYFLSLWDLLRGRAEGAGWVGVATLLGGAGALGGITYFTVTERSSEFKIATSVCAVGAVGLIISMVAGSHTVCQSCAGFDLTLIILWLSNGWKGRAGYICGPVSLLVALLPGLVLVERSRPTTGDDAVLPGIPRYEGEETDTRRTNLVLFADPNTPSSRKLIGKFLARSKQYQVFARWVVLAPPVESGKRVAAILASLQAHGDPMFGPLLQDLSSSKGDFADPQLRAFAEGNGIQDEVKGLLSHLPQDGGDRLTSDAHAAALCKIAKLPAVFLVVGESPTKSTWTIVADDQYTDGSFYSR